MLRRPIFFTKKLHETMLFRFVYSRIAAKQPNFFEEIIITSFGKLVAHFGDTRTHVDHQHNCVFDRYFHSSDND